MVFTDTHTHLYLEQFKDDVDLVIERAISKGDELEDWYDEKPSASPPGPAKRSTIGIDINEHNNF